MVHIDATTETQRTRSYFIQSYIGFILGSFMVHKQRLLCEVELLNMKCELVGHGISGFKQKWQLLKPFRYQTLR